MNAVKHICREQAWTGLSGSAAEAAAPAGYPPLPDWYSHSADPPPLLGAGRGAALVTPHFAGASGLLTGLPHCAPPLRPPPGLPGQEHGALAEDDDFQELQ